MEYINVDKLYSDGKYRFDYVAKFVDFGEEDIKVIQQVADQLRPLAPSVVNAVYEKLFTFDVTKTFFLSKNEGFEGEVPPTLEELTLDHPQIKFRKDFLGKYLNKLLSGPYDDRFLRYLDWVAKIHTDTPDKKSKINVDYIHVNALMGYVESILINGLLSLNLDRDTETKALLAFNKLLWIQNDYFAKYYASPSKQLGHQVNPTSASASCCALLTSSASILPTVVGALAGGLAVYFTLKHQH
ncbi:Protoglobin-domain-containing protein [Cunninghamella echinulata]|nr:Protoglobin-domain-containing protein [Cunninghamella echinulata]